jgi:phosphate transport system protein
MSKLLQRHLSEVEHALSAQADAVETMVQVAYEGLRERCLGSAAEVLDSESQLNLTEVDIEEKCLELLALHQPVAIDLRRVAATLKINGDLERIGDLALNLAERTEDLARCPDVPVPAELEKMVERAIEMLRDAHRAFVHVDEELAQSVRQRDDEVDDLNRRVIGDLVKQMESRPHQVEGLLHVFSATRIIERIADHATNIAEDVIFLAKGEIARHRWSKSA